MGVGTPDSDARGKGGLYNKRGEHPHLANDAVQLGVVRVSLRDAREVREIGDEADPRVPGEKRGGPGGACQTHHSKEPCEMRSKARGTHARRNANDSAALTWLESRP
jgi:hypothetical protein